MGFAEDLQKICLRAQDKTEKVVRRAALELFSEMVNRSPVGNPDLWEANKAKVYARETYNLFAGALNESIGKGKGRVRKKSAKTLRKEFANKVGANYTGGRFKNNWQLGIGSLNTDTGRDASSSGNGALKAFGATIKAWKPGQTIYLTNSMAYAYRLEHGWSKQAPSGMVRLAVQNFNQALAKAAKEVK